MNPTQDQTPSSEEDLKYALIGILSQPVSNQSIENLLVLIDEHTAKAVLKARIDEQQTLIDNINQNSSDKYPQINEEDILTYISHGHALACKQFKNNANVRIAELKSQGENK